MHGKGASGNPYCLVDLLSGFVKFLQKIKNISSTKIKIYEKFLIIFEMGIVFSF